MWVHSGGRRGRWVDSDSHGLTRVRLGVVGFFRVRVGWSSSSLGFARGERWVWSGSFEYACAQSGELGVDGFIGVRVGSLTRYYRSYDTLHFVDLLRRSVGSSSRFSCVNSRATRRRRVHSGSSGINEVSSRSYLLAWVQSGALCVVWTLVFAWVHSHANISRIDHFSSRGFTQAHRRFIWVRMSHSMCRRDH